MRGAGVPVGPVHDLGQALTHEQTLARCMVVQTEHAAAGPVRGIGNATLENLKSGVELTLKQLSSVFEKFKIVEVNPAGAKFDPHQHQAISTVEAEQEPNTVVQVFQKGYLLNERVMRPAMVSVASSDSLRSFRKGQNRKRWNAESL